MRRGTRIFVTLLALAAVMMWGRSLDTLDEAVCPVGGGCVRVESVPQALYVALVPGRALTPLLRARRWPPVPHVWTGQLVPSYERDAVSGVRALHVPYWLFLAPAVIIAGRARVARRRARLRGARGLCVACGYDLRGSPDRCPECGAVPAGAQGNAEAQRR